MKINELLAEAVSEIVKGASYKVTRGFRGMITSHEGRDPGRGADYVDDGKVLYNVYADESSVYYNKSKNGTSEWSVDKAVFLRNTEPFAPKRAKKKES